ncbi:MAG: DEAD/DEAH box helicase [Ardenticatenaceae bacterium]|nr:DEAD/DEAH box helicase [Anaerolineales bacterium]MCB8922364.1 DEAD/DEAH box helicase [Ardenticatenaceae bacterium]
MNQTETGHTDVAERQEANASPESQALPEVTYDDLPESWQQAMARAGWTSLMPVQAKAMPYVMAGRDLMVQSRTGSGKTGAFVMPILERINPLQNACQALVLVPTRELAVQVATDARTLAGEDGVRVTAVYGGVGYGAQLDAFRKGAHLVVGTPGRVLDHLLRRSLNLDKLKILVFDEADRLLSMGFYPDMREVQRYLPEKGVDGYMFSATFPPRVRGLAEQFLHKPDFLGLSSDNVHVVETEHVFYTVPGMDKDRSLVRLIEVENPDSAIIFCNTKAKVHYVAVVLQRFGYDADELSADLSQNDREKVLNRVRAGSLRFLIATDVAARGIDIPELSHVIQYEPPEDSELYIHRAGRTGRAGASGEAISLVDVVERTKLRRIAQKYEIDLLERPLPSDEDVAAVVAERATVLLETKLRTRDKLQAERMQRFVPLARSLSEGEDGLALLAMLLDDEYQQAVHTPPPLPKPSASHERKGDGRKRSGRRKRRR